MIRPVPLVIELCAGLASVSGALQHGLQWKPPISRMGRKTGYAEAILRVMGLRPRQGAERYLWAEADSDVAALLAAYTQPEMMRQTADIIRSWIPCPYGPHEGWCLRCKGAGRWDARDLWEVLRREKRRGLWGDVEPTEVAAFCNEVAWSKGNQRGGMYMGPDRPSSCHAEGWTASITSTGIADRFDRAALPWPPVLIAQDARIEPGEVAGWAAKMAWDRPGQDAFSDAAGGMLNPSAWKGTPLEATASRFSCLIWPPVHLTPDAAIQPPQIPPGTVVYFDPPYAGTTGYKHDLPRAEVIQIAEHWAADGARVYISEAEPLPIPGWHHVEIGGERKGQKRTFGDTQEWLTCSHPPAWRPPVQGGLF